jgi:hypothetical protein
MTLAQELPLSEAYDLEAEIGKIGPWKTKIILNQSLTNILEESADLPEFYLKKIRAEKEILKQHPKLPLISFSKSNKTPELVKEMTKQMELCL